MNDHLIPARVQSPYTLSVPAGASGRYLYLIGGSYSEDSGCPPWGTSDPADMRLIGDRLGSVAVTFGDGTMLSVPLVLGRTLWLHSVWNESPAPFFGPEEDKALSARLRACLCLYGAYDHAETWVMRVRLPGAAVASVTVLPEPGKLGKPLFEGCRVTDDETIPEAGDGAADFFASHTVDPADPVPAGARRTLDDVQRALCTFEADFDDAPRDFEIPAGVLPYTIRFTGGRLSGIATANVFCNMKNLDDRTDPSGFVHTSYQDAPSWRYDGFGPYVMRANSYTSLYYSRDAGRAIMTLTGYGHVDKAKAACLFGDDWMMAYPRDGVTLGGIPVPGHFSVMPNQPYIYSRVLSKMAAPALCDDKEGSTASAWPTRYTKERFGGEYENLGNQETDGHGLMMMANYLTWCARGQSVSEALEHWDYIAEAAKWLVWCFDHPELSFVENDLLYGETEAAMNAYTLYANIPCWLGLCGYADMAESVGRTAEAALWRSYAARLHAGIDRGFAAGLTDGDGWKRRQHGFFHDPVVTFLSDVYGFDTADMPAGWVARSRASYRGDLDATVAHGWYGPRGIGYDHCMITQNALLLDETADASRLLESLCKLCWSPRLPDPYMVPEGLTVDVSRGLLRRQGDLGNLVQLAEAMKCWRIAVGIAPVLNGRCKLMPRLPAGWGVTVRDFPLQNTALALDLDVSPVEGDGQRVDLCVKGGTPGTPGVSLSVRFGPFPADCMTAHVVLNGQALTLPTAASGDARWAWAEL